MAVVKSISYSQDEILKSIVDLHCDGAIECDVTYGNGMFYKSLPEPKYKFDLDPQLPGVIKADSGSLPMEDASVKSIMFDPPFLTYVSNGRSHGDGKMVMSSRFGGYWRYDELKDHYTRTIAEARRVLSNGGKLVIKCQDIIHNHALHCTHFNVIQWASKRGFRLVDLFILAASNRINTPGRKQKHARVYHSYFMVFEKTPHGQYSQKGL